jgi:hypothetical protein
MKRFYSVHGFLTIKRTLILPHRGQRIWEDAFERMSRAFPYCSIAATNGRNFVTIDLDLLFSACRICAALAP